MGFFFLICLGVCFSLTHGSARHVLYIWVFRHFLLFSVWIVPEPGISGVRAINDYVMNQVI